jgi:hypothetical protein
MKRRMKAISCCIEVILAVLGITTMAAVLASCTPNTTSRTQNNTSGTSNKISGTSLLHVSAANPRYFEDASGHVVYLTGSHNWFNLQDGAAVGKSTQAFDYNSYLSFLRSHNMNFARLWNYEGWEYCGSMTSPAYYVPLPYLRAGPGTALDGGLKYDLNQFNQAYFDRLRSRVQAAKADGIYVGIMLFQGWSSCSTGVWLGHPYNASNNINGVNGDLNGDGTGIEIHSLQNGSTIDALQKAYIRKVVDTVNDLDNVLFEIENEENPGDNVRWQDSIVEYIKSYESPKPHQHPVGITTPWSSEVTSSELFAGPADWISPSGSWGYGSNPPTATGQKVILADTDHIFGMGGDSAWVWETFTRGNNPLYMDDLSQNSTMESARVAMGQTRSYANKMNLATMTPRGDLTSTGYALANPGHEYLAYNPSGGSFSVNLSDAALSDSFSVEWFNPGSGAADLSTGVSRGGTVAGGATRAFSPPFHGAVVLYLLKQSSAP